MSGDPVDMIPRRIIAGSLRSPMLGVDVEETKFIERHDEYGEWTECIGFTVHVRYPPGLLVYYQIEYRARP